MIECEYCGTADAFVRFRILPNDPPVALCADCWLDVQAGLQKERQEP